MWPDGQSDHDIEKAVTPVRVEMGDQPADILHFAVNAFEYGGVALATLVDIRGGAARALGAHVAIAADGRFCGYVSGGCVEAAVASEAMMAMADGRDRFVVYGEGSPFFDIVLPCGGGITVAIHVLRNVDAVRSVLADLEARIPVGLKYSPDAQTIEKCACHLRASWQGSTFVTAYRPATRVIVSGAGAEADATVRLAIASGWDVVAAGGNEYENAEMIDEFTAVVLLHHDLDAEDRVLNVAMLSPAFYVGALGSTHTHRRRSERLQALGFSNRSIDRIKAPIGIFGPTRDATSLALSIVADIAASRLAAYG